MRIGRLVQNTKRAKWEMLYEFKTFALHKSFIIVLHFDGTSSVWVQYNTYVGMNPLEKDQDLYP